MSDIYAAGDTNQIRCGDTIMGLNSAANELNRLTRDLAAANATVEKCKAAGFIDEQGEVRKVAHGLPLPITADGVIAMYGESYWYWDRVNNYHDPIKYGWTERQLESCKPSEDAEYSFTTDPSLCYSTKEAALGAKP